jgi:hypothetical protein
MKITSPNRRAVFGATVTAVVLSTVWFLCVRESAYYEACNHCDSRRVSVETQVFGLVVSRRFHSEKESFDARLARDLGSPCEHCFVRQLLARKYGLLLVCNSHDIPLSFHPLPVPDWYETDGLAILTTLKAKNPGLPEEFRARVFFNSDREFSQRLIQSIRELSQSYKRSAKSCPGPPTLDNR